MRIRLLGLGLVALIASLIYYTTRLGNVDTVSAGSRASFGNDKVSNVESKSSPNRIKVRRRQIETQTDEEVLSGTFEDRLLSCMGYFIKTIKDEELLTAEVVAHYIEDNGVEVAAVKFTSLASGRIMALHADVQRALDEKFKGDERSRAQREASAILDRMLDGEHPYNGLVVAVPVDGTGAPRFSWVRSAGDSVFKIEPSGKIKTSVGAGTFRIINEKTAEDRFGFLLSLE